MLLEVVALVGAEVARQTESFECYLGCSIVGTTVETRPGRVIVDEG